MVSSLFRLNRSPSVFANLFISFFSSGNNLSKEPLFFIKYASLLLMSWLKASFMALALRESHLKGMVPV